MIVVICVKIKLVAYAKLHMALVLIAIALALENVRGPESNTSGHTACGTFGLSQFSFLGFP